MWTGERCQRFKRMIQITFHPPAEALTDISDGLGSVKQVRQSAVAEAVRSRPRPTLQDSTMSDTTEEVKPKTFKTQARREKTVAGTNRHPGSRSIQETYCVMDTCR